MLSPEVPQCSAIAHSRQRVRQQLIVLQQIVPTTRLQIALAVRLCGGDLSTVNPRLPVDPSKGAASLTPDIVRYGAGTCGCGGRSTTSIHAAGVARW